MVIDWVAIILFNDKERATAENLIHRMVKRAVEMEGTVTGEHGVGLIKRDYLPYEMGESTVDAMRKVRPLLLRDLNDNINLISSNTAQASF